MLNVVILNVVMLNVVMLNVVMMKVMPLSLGLPRALIYASISWYQGNESSLNKVEGSNHLKPMKTNF
jgi:hypothetical protein